MKRCPQCDRVYSDETLNFCLEDGSSLEAAPGVAEHTMLILHETAPPSEQKTSVLNADETAAPDSDETEPV